MIDCGPSLCTDNSAGNDLQQSDVCSHPGTILFARLGRTTRAVLNACYGVPHTTSIVEGHALPHDTKHLYLACRDLTHHPFKLTMETENGDASVLCQFWLSNEVLDVQQLIAANEHFCCAEAFSPPEFLCLEYAEIHQTAYASIMKWYVNILPHASVLLSYYTIFRGGVQRMQREISPPVRTKIRIRIAVPQERRHFVCTSTNKLSV
eukprot:TsM_000387500 transcript=TsM_000387500 gene=TsM_000387500